MYENSLFEGLAPKPHWNLTSLISTTPRWIGFGFGLGFTFAFGFGFGATLTFPGGARGVKLAS